MTDLLVKNLSKIRNIVLKNDKFMKEHKRKYFHMISVIVLCMNSKLSFFPETSRSWIFEQNVYSAGILIPDGKE